MDNVKLPKGSIRKKGKKFEGSFYNTITKRHEYIRENTESLCQITLNQLIYYTIQQDDKMVQKIKNDNSDRNSKKSITARHNIAFKTFKEVFEYWLSEINTSSVNTKNDYLGILNNHFKTLSKKTFNKITDFEIQNLYNTLRKKKDETFLYRIHKCLSAFYNAMYKKKIIPTNYMDFIDIPKKKKAKHALVKDVDYEHIMFLLRTNKDPKTFYLYGLAILAGGMGLRIGESLGFTFPYLFLEEDYINIDKQITHQKGKGYYLSNELKTPSSHRNVVFIPQVKEELKTYLITRKHFVNQLIKVKKITNDPIFVLINKSGGFIPTNTAERHWVEFKIKHNINEKIRIHDLRRYFAKFLLKHKVPDMVSKKALGHTDINMTEFYQDDDDIDISKHFISKINNNSMENSMENKNNSMEKTLEKEEEH